MQYFVIMFSISAFPISSDLAWYMGTVILDVIKYCDYPRWYEKIPPGGGTSDWRCHLQSEVGPLIGGDTSNWR